MDVWRDGRYCVVPPLRLGGYGLRLAVGLLDGQDFAFGFWQAEERCGWLVTWLYDEYGKRVAAVDGGAPLAVRADGGEWRYDVWLHVPHITQ